jgi:hypothetical protein
MSYKKRLFNRIEKIILTVKIMINITISIDSLIKVKS